MYTLPDERWMLFFLILNHLLASRQLLKPYSSKNVTSNNDVANACAAVTYLIAMFYRDISMIGVFVVSIAFIIAKLINRDDNAFLFGGLTLVETMLMGTAVIPAWILGSTIILLILVIFLVNGHDRDPIL
ncbi:MAG: hypothetical protein R8L53_08960 [Mariprofundales bacterium]